MAADNLVALIMAGGRGERLWPRSTSSTPKHLLRFSAKKTMLEETIGRLSALVPLERLFIITGKESASSIKKLCPALPPPNIIIEPYPRNTAACIGLAVIFIKKRFPGALISVFPSDHIIKGKKRFLDTVGLAARWAEREKALVTIGMRPHRPETGYGYIELCEKNAEKKGIAVHRVKRFVEKPDLKRARLFVSSKKYLWNGGMFVFKSSVLLDAFKLYMPQLHRALLKIDMRLDSDRDEVIKRVYKGLRNISIDYGVMEKAENRLVVTADFFWSDVGSWLSLEEIYPKDRNGGISLGETLSLDTRGSILVSDKGLLVALGVKDMAVISAKDATLVFPKNRAQEVKKVLAAIRKKKSLRKYL